MEDNKTHSDSSSCSRRLTHTGAYLFFLHLQRLQRWFVQMSDVGSRLGGSEGGLSTVRFGQREPIRLGDVGVGPRLCCGVVPVGQLLPLIFSHLHKHMHTFVCKGLGQS